MPAGVVEHFLPVSGSDESKSAYRPALLGKAQVHYVLAKANIDVWQDLWLVLDCQRGLPTNMWAAASDAGPLDLCKEPEAGIEFSDLPAELRSAANFKNWTKALKDYLYRDRQLNLFYCAALKAYAPIGATEGEARIHLGQKARELRDEEITKIRAKYSKLDDQLTKRLQTAKEKLEREKVQYDSVKWSSVVEAGATILGGLFGNKRSRLSSTRVSTAARSASKAGKKWLMCELLKKRYKRSPIKRMT